MCGVLKSGHIKIVGVAGTGLMVPNHTHNERSKNGVTLLLS